MAGSLSLDLNFLKKLVFTVFSRGSSAVLGIVISIMIARNLAVEEQGYYSVFLATSLLAVQFLSLGVNSANTFFVAQDIRHKQTLISNSVLLAFASALVWALYLSFSKYVVQVEYFPNSQLMQLSILLVPLELLFGYLQSLSLGLPNLKYFNTVDILRKLVNISLLASVFFSGNFALITIIYCVIASNLISLSFLAYMVFDNFRLHASLELFKKSLKYGIWIYAGTLFAFFILRLNLLMVNYYLGPLQSGIFSIALSISDALYLLPTTIGMVAFASFVKERDLYVKWKLVKRIALSLACLLIVLFGMVLLFTHELTVLLYGDKFSAAIVPIRYLLPGLFCLSILTQFQNFLSSVENPKLVCVGPFVAVLVNVAANLILIPRYELIGAAVATSLSYAVWFAITLTLSVNKVKNEQHRSI